MTGRQRTLAFLDGRPVDRRPCHPIIMRWAARYAGVPYRDFYLDYRRKCEAMIRCADDFDLDWVTVMSDPYCEASAFGLDIEYPEDGLPAERGGHLSDLAAAARLRPFRPLEHPRPANRLDEIREFKRRTGSRLFVVGWVEGPVAEYADLRGVSSAALDFLDDPDAVLQALAVIAESALEFIALQVEAGADCIGIGDSFCSQIGPDLYRRLAFDGCIGTQTTFPFGTPEAMRRTVRALADDGAKLVVLDASDVGFLDSSGLRVIVNTGQALTSAGGRLVIDGMSPAVHRVLEVSGLLDQYRA